MTSALMLIGLGFVIAVAARSMPGDDEQDALGELSVSVPDWVGNVFLWGTLAVAGLFAIYILMAMRRGGSWAGFRRALFRMLTLILWAGGFYLIYAITRPPQEGAPVTPPPPLEPNEVVDTINVDPSVTASWVAGVLLTLILVAAVVRIVMAMRSDSQEEEEVSLKLGSDATVEDELAEPLTMVASTDPRARVINAYAEFEGFSKEKGLGRRVSETARHHTRRTGTDLGAQPDDLRELGNQYEKARFAETPVDADNAEIAEGAWQRIRKRIGS
ncbi:MAG TPA: DUF4129 domain-containing protein [Acidimicrobiia bacterium]|nr:DUF4129 domain-containing protein [Acidimicrobiia bacterium]